MVFAISPCLTCFFTSVWSPFLNAKEAFRIRQERDGFFLVGRQGTFQWRDLEKKKAPSTAATAATIPWGWRHQSESMDAAGGCWCCGLIEPPKQIYQMLTAQHVWITVVSNGFESKHDQTYPTDPDRRWCVSIKVGTPFGCAEVWQTCRSVTEWWTNMSGRGCFGRKSQVLRP